MKKDKEIYLPFKQVKELVLKLGLKTSTEWFKWARFSTRPINVPIVIHSVYKREWTNWYDFLGKKKIVFLSYIDSQKIALNNRIKNKRQWFNLVRTHRYNLPLNPDVTYKNKGWINWMVFLNKYRKMEKYHVNHNYFSKWSHNMAYILGFWWADGNITKHNNIFSICQHIKDKYILEVITKEMGSNYPINTWENISIFKISSPQMCKDIKKLGGCPNKSLTTKMPVIPKKYLSDFVRGYFDGDGSIYTYKSCKSHKYRSDFTSGSKKFIYRLLRELRISIPKFKGYISKIIIPAGYKIRNRIIKKETVYYRLRMGTNDTIRLGEFIYCSSPELMLERKYNRFVLAGEINPLYEKNRVLSFKKARKHVHKLNIRIYDEWLKYCKSGKKPFFIPASPALVYKNKGWIDYRDWFGTKKYLSYKEASNYFIKNKIKNSTDWYKICLRKKRPNNIPYEPNEIYKNNGWVDWEHFCKTDHKYHMTGVH